MMQYVDDRVDFWSTAKVFDKRGGSRVSESHHNLVVVLKHVHRSTVAVNWKIEHYSPM